jgi:hypothetical protein
MKFIWHTWAKAPSDDELGHGLCIYDRKRNPDNQIIAFVDGYDWYHGRSEIVLIRVIKPDITTTSEILKELRQILERYLKKNELPYGMLTSRIEVWANA